MVSYCSLRQRPLSSSVMRHLIIIAMLALCSAHAQAKCMPQRCYAVAFEVATCHTTRDDRPMWRGRVADGIVLGAKQQPVARVVPCYSGLEIPANTLPTVEQIESTWEFFYYADSCHALEGHKVTLFAPEPLCHDTGSSSQPEPHQTVLTALPIWAQ